MERETGTGLKKDVFISALLEARTKTTHLGMEALLADYTSVLAS
jgi:hypothetical protein